MKRILFLTIALQLFVSCSSDSKKTGEITDDEFAWITNEDFNEQPQIEKPVKDYYEASDSGQVGRETLAVIPDAKIDSTDISDDPLGSAMSGCYKKDFDSAFKKLDALYRSNKKNPAYWNQLGSCYYLKNEKLKALIYYNKARDLDEKYAPVINNLGVLYLNDGKDQKALAAFKKASDVSKFSLVPIYNTALLFLKYHLNDEAYPLLFKLRSKIEGNVEFNNAFAVSNMLKQQYREAVSIYEDIKSDYLEYPQIGLNAALAYYRSGDKAKAVKILKDVDLGKNSEMRDYYRQVSKELGE